MSGHGSYGHCQKCKKQIIWIRTVAGKNMPCDAEIKYYKEEVGGKDRIVLPNGQVVVGTILKGPSLPMDMDILHTLPHVNFHRCSGGKRKYA